ncbi:autotransporter domain-containing protein [Desulfovibrio sp. JY]|nr:autotransporter domain-containing protein [Desulfovibrio sp. JY]
MAGSITATVTEKGSSAYGMLAAGGAISIGGGLSGSITATATGDGGRAYGLKNDAGSISISGPLSGSIIATATGSSGRAYGVSTPSGDFSISGPLSGSITATATGSSGTAYGIYTSGSVSIDSIAGTGRILAEGAADAVGLNGASGVTITHDMAGSIIATATGSSGSAYGMLAYGHAISIGGPLSGSITATVTGDGGHAYGVAISSIGDISISGPLSGSITATATGDGGRAYGVNTSSGDISISGPLSGSITAMTTGAGGAARGIYSSKSLTNGSGGALVISSTGSVSAISDGMATAVLSHGQLLLTVEGKLSATNTSGHVFDSGYAIQSSSGNDGVTLADGATIIGRIDLGSGNDSDTLKLLGTPNADTNIPLISGVETLDVGDGTTATNWSLAPTSASSFTTTTIYTNAALTINSNVSLGALTLDGGMLRPSEDMTYSGDVALSVKNGTFDTNGYAMTLAGVVSGSGALTKTGSGTLTLAGTNTYTGATNINGGTLSISSAANLQDTSGITLDGGTLQATNTLALDKSIALGASGGTFAVGNGSDTLTLAGVVSGSGALTKTGSGTLTLAGTNTYTGATNINGGTLSISSAANLQGTSGITLDGGTLQATNTLELGKSIALGASGGTFAVANSSDTLTLSGAITDAVPGTAGSLTKTGAGTLKLTNTGNTYSGPTFINQGTLQAGAVNAFSPNSVVVLANAAGATLDLNNYDQVIAGLSGGGSNGGNVSLGSATLTVNQAIDTTYAGVISGTGSLKKSGSGTLTLTGTNTYTGGTLFAGGTIAVASDANLGDASGSLTFDGGTLKTTNDFAISRDIEAASTGTLDNGGNSVSLQGSLTGSGALTLAGSGTVTLDTGFDASTSTGTVIVANGTTLAGVGKLHNLTVNGIISPGHSPGTITVGGDFTLGSTGTYVCQVSASGDSDLINVTGKATLSGTLTVVAVDTTYTSGTSWNILQASSVSGTYSNVTYAGTPQNWVFVPGVSGTGATLTLTRQSYSTASSSSQSSSTGSALDAAAYTATGEMASLITVLDNSYGLADASWSSAQTLASAIRSTTQNALTDYSLNVLSAEVYDAFSRNVFAAGRLLTAAQRSGLHEGEDGVGQGFANPLEIGPSTLASQNNQYGLALGLDTAGVGASSLSLGRLGVFIKPLGMRAFQQGSSNRTGYSAVSGGITGGLLYRPSSKLTLALAPGFVTQSISVHSEGGGQGTVNDWSLGLLAAYRSGPWHADAGVRGAYNTFRSSRSLPLPMGSYTAKGNWDGWNVDVSAGGGYDFTAGDYTFGPLAAVSWQRLHENGFAETGAGTLGQSIRPRNTEALNTVLGARLARTFETSAGDVTPEVRLGWSAQWLDASQNITASFIGASGSTYQVKSADHAYNSALVDIGVSMRVSPSLTATTRAGVELFRPGYESQAASVGLKYSF